MKNRNHSISYLQIVVGFIVAVLLLAVLSIDNVNLVWGIIWILFADASYLTLRHGWQWLKGNQSRVSLQERFLVFLASLMFLFLMSGTALFLKAFLCEEDAGGKIFINAEYLLRSLECSFQLFTGNIEGNVVDGIGMHPYLKGCIALQAFLSFCCTVASLLSLAYARVSAYYKLHRKTKIDSFHNHLYIFFGLNAPSRLLAKSIKTREGEKAVVVFVENRTPSDDDQSGWGSIVSIFTHRRQTFLDIDELDARVTFTEVSLSDLSSDKLRNLDILEELNLVRLRGLINSLSKGIQDSQMHIFFLSEDEDENIRSLSVLALDETIQKTKKTINQRFYCHARQNGLNRIVEDIAFKQEIEVRIIDSSYMAVELLKADAKNHPIRFVDIDTKNPTTVKSEFDSLIIGFDEVGRDSLKFLYEFGAFVDSNASPLEEHRSPFHCVVVDKRMNELEGSFVNFTPAVLGQVNADGSPLVELRSCDCLGKDFYEQVLCSKFCQSLNYIVVAIGDDELGMTLAIRMLNHIRRVREDLSRLRIYVRSYRTDKEEYMQKIATHYSEGYNRSSKKEYQNDAVIQLFGQAEQIYSYDIIVNEELTAKGRIFKEGYARLKGEKMLWDTRRKKEQDKGSLDSLRRLRRQESQDLANALHVGTKIFLLQKSMLAENAEYNWRDLMRRYFDSDSMPQCEGSYDKIKYPLLTAFENSAILNLARLEHIRWIASHEMLGYTKANKELHSCDERTRQHNCLRPWQELDEEGRMVTKLEGWACDYKLFDFGVVDNSILLSKDRLETSTL